MTRYVVFTVVLILFSSCKNNTIFTKYKSIHENKWHRDSIVNFEVEITDTLSKNAIYLNLRNDKAYGFNNIYLIVGVDYPNKIQVTDTLEFRMTDEKGRFLGTGFTDIKENKLEFKENIQFPNKGKYTFKIQQAIRKNGQENGVVALKGITDVGIEIEKIE